MEENFLFSLSLIIFGISDWRAGFSLWFNSEPFGFSIANRNRSLIPHSKQLAALVILTPTRRGQRTPALKHRGWWARHGSAPGTWAPGKNSQEGSISGPRHGRTSEEAPRHSRARFCRQPTLPPHTHYLGDTELPAMGNQKLCVWSPPSHTGAALSFPSFPGAGLQTHQL